MRESPQMDFKGLVSADDKCHFCWDKVLHRALDLLKWEHVYRPSFPDGHSSFQVRDSRELKLFCYLAGSGPDSDF